MEENKVTKMKSENYDNAILKISNAISDTSISEVTKYKQLNLLLYNMLVNRR